MIYLNYLIEANVGLAFFALVYFIVLRNETHFKFNRYFLLSGISCSIIFPLFDFSQSSIVQLGELIPSTGTWLPELTVGADNISPGANQFPWMILFEIVYSLGVLLFLGIFVQRIYSVLRMIRKNNPTRYENLMLAEACDNTPTFSFFNFVIIGNNKSLTPLERKCILDHERVHVQRLHSLDIMIVAVAGIFFWFNPLLRFYKKTFVQLHEFEADSRAAENHGPDEYCNLMARVALLSADLSIANHFSNSLTLKRIQMVRKIKIQISRWKLAAVAAAVPLFFIISACNDEIVNEVTEVAKESYAALDVPANIQARFDELSKSNPEKKYVLLELSETGMETLKNLEQKFGLPKSMEMFNGDDVPIRGASAAGVIIERNNKSANEKISNARSFVILEYDQNLQRVGEMSKSGNVFTVVEETARPAGGMTAFYEAILKTILYPKDAREQGVEGKVFVEFIVETDGTLSSFNVLKGLHPSIDAEAIRVLESSPEWIPGKHQGQAVRQKMVLPISFYIIRNQGAAKSPSQTNDSGNMQEIVVTSYAQ